MGILDFFRRSAPEEAPETTVSQSASQTASAEQNSFVGPGHEVLAVEAGEDGFLQVEHRRLSYAEVAALHGDSDAPRRVVDVGTELGRDVTDYELAEALQRQMNCHAMQQLVKYGESDEFDFPVGGKIARKVAA